MKEFEWYGIRNDDKKYEIGVIGSDVCYGGNDANEIIMVDAEVLKEF